MTQKEININILTERLRLIYESIDELTAIIVPKENYKIEFINPKAYKSQLNWDEKDLINKSFLKIIYPEDIQKTSNFLKKSDSLFDNTLKLRLLDKNRKEQWYEIKSKLINNNSGERRQLIKLNAISKQKELEHKLGESKESLKKITDEIPEIRFWRLFSPIKYEEALKNSYQMLQMVIENIPQFIFWKDNNLRYLGSNENYAKLIGADFSENLLGKKDGNFIEDEQKIKLLAEKENQILITGKPEINQLEEWNDSKENLIFNVNRIPLSNSNRKTIGILVSYDNVTQLKQKELELRKERDLLKRIMTASPAAILMVNKKGNITYANSQAQELLALDEESNIFEGSILSSLNMTQFNGKLFKKENLPFNIVKRTLKPIKDIKIAIRNPRGERKLLSINAVPLFDNSGGFDGMVSILDDITDKIESERKYKTLLETSSVGILEINFTSKKISYMNSRLEEIVGYSMDELNKSALEKVIHPDDLKKLFLNSEEKELEYRICDSEGVIKWLSGKRVNEYDEDGNLKVIRLWLDDVTEKKKYETLITELNINFLSFSTEVQKNIEKLLETCKKLIESNIAVYFYLNHEKNQLRIITDEGEVITVDDVDKKKDNIFFFELFKENHDFPQTILDLNQTKYHKTDPILKVKNIKSAYGKLINSEGSINEGICVFFKENPITSHQDQLVLFLIGDAIEIERKRWQAKKQLEDQNIMLNEMNKLKSELVSRTSHELKTPLISIKGFTELLLKIHKHKLDSDMVSIVEEIMHGAKRLEKTINNLLKSSKLNQNLLKMNKTEEDLTFLLKFCVNELRGLVNLRNQDIELDIHDKIIANFDKERIYEVISNLIVNAIKYTPPKGKITIKSEISEDLITISVKDTGIGLSKNEKTQLFKQFGKIERYGRGWDLGIEGSGLGLFIAKRIIDLHGGEIWAHSEGRNKGSTFSFQLPKA